MNELPFELNKLHKITSKSSWKKQGLNMDNFEEIYQDYIHSTNCDLCSKEFQSSRERHMEHDHQTGEFRNIVCCKCNVKKKDRNQSNNTSGYIGINKSVDKKCKQGFTWRFEVYINNKKKCLKTCINLEKLIKFADKWKIENNYNT